MPRSFLVKKYLKQKYDEDQIKLQALREASGLTNDDDGNSINAINGDNNENNKNNCNSNDVIVSLLTTANSNSRTADDSKTKVTAPYTPLVSLPGPMQPLSVKYNNGYIHDVTYIQTGFKTEQATIPRIKDEAAVHERNAHQPRRSVIVTNANHPANRHLSSHLGHHDVIEPVNSPPMAFTAGEQFMPYDYSLPRSDRPPAAHTPTSAVTPALQPSPGPAVAHESSSATLAYAPLSSPPPAHHGFEPQPVHASPRRTPPSHVEFLPADHPFNHPLIQQLINQRLHVPSEKSGEVHHLNGKGSIHDDEDGYSFVRLPHQNFSGSDVQAASETRLNDYEMNDARLGEGQERVGELHYTTSGMLMSASSILTTSHLTPIHTHPSFHPHSHPNFHPFPPSPSPTIPSSSPTLPFSESKSQFILPPPTPPTPSTIHSSPCHTRLTASPHPPSPASSPTPPASSSSSSTFFNNSSSILVGNHRDALTAKSENGSSSNNNNNHLNNNNNVIANNNDINDEDQNVEATPKASAYTYDAFLISDGRSRKRTHDQVVETRDSGRLRYTCNECGKDYATSSNLSRHKQTHRALDSKNAKKCPHCDKVYVSMPALSMHILTHDLKHACNICGKTFSRPWLLQGHMRSHTGEKPFGCAHCGKAFADRSNLRAHMQTHSAFKHFACSKCNKSFALKSYLNKHLESSCLKD